MEMNMLEASYSLPNALTLQPLTTKALVATKGYHMVISTSIPMNRKARRMEGNTGKYAGATASVNFVGFMYMEKSPS
jgi:hypothetical protein